MIVFVSHRWGGGIRRHMHDLAALLGERALVLFLEPAVDDTVKLHWPRAGESFAAYFRLPFDLPRLAGLLTSIGVARLHFHHVHQLPRAILDLPAAAGIPYDCTLHDYYAICPQYHLVTEDGEYCGEPDARGCGACLARRPRAMGARHRRVARGVRQAVARRRPADRAVGRRRAADGPLLPRRRDRRVAASRAAPPPRRASCAW